MKKVTCDALSEGQSNGCNHLLQAETAEEMADTGMAHAKEAHPELAEKWSSAPKDEMGAWMEKFKGEFANLEDA